MIMNTNEGVSYTKFYNNTSRHTSIKILSSDWVNKACTKAILGINSDTSVIFSPDNSSVAVYYSSIIKGSIQSTNLAAFTCVNTPSTDVIVDVLIIPTQLPGGGLNRLEISGDWTNIQYVGGPIDPTGLIFTAIYNDGSTLAVNALSELTVWGNTVGVQSCTFSYTQGSTTVTASKNANVSAAPKPMGGILYYIDPTGDGTYQFYDANGDLTSAPTVGTDCTNWTYISLGVTKDKYYIFDDYSRGECRWTYYDNGSYVLNAIGGTSQNIGSGKNNTAIIMAADNGAYITDNSNGKPTAWYLLKQLNDGLLGGCNDWYVPSKNEAEELRKAIGYEIITTSDSPVVVQPGPLDGNNIPGTSDGGTHYKDYSTTRTCYPADTKFLSRYYWSSSEGSSSDATAWKTNRQSWNSNSKGDNMHFFAIRSC